MNGIPFCDDHLEMEIIRLVITMGLGDRFEAKEVRPEERSSGAAAKTLERPVC
jgi:hypothetical protein